METSMLVQTPDKPTKGCPKEAFQALHNGSFQRWSVKFKSLEMSKKGHPGIQVSGRYV